MKKLTQMLVIVLCLMSVGCASVSNRDIGLLAGGAAGAGIGHAVSDNATGTAIGAVGGAFIGSKIGEGYDY